jgi:hypothetical protein
MQTAPADNHVNGIDLDILTESVRNKVDYEIGPR